MEILSNIFHRFHFEINGSTISLPLKFSETDVSNNLSTSLNLVSFFFLLSSNESKGNRLRSCSEHPDVA